MGAFIERIKIITDFGEFEADIINKNPKTTSSILDCLPLEARVNRWGDEIYFQVPVEVDLEEGEEVVNVGDLAFWPDGSALCIFFGPTPLSEPDKIKPVSPVNVFARTNDIIDFLKEIKDGDRIRVVKL